MKSALPKIIQGYWDGKPIWRYKTTGELLADEIKKNKHARKEKDTSQSTERAGK